MASHDFSNITYLPKFDGLNFLIWKVKMTLFLKTLEFRVVKAVTKEFLESHSNENTGSEAIAKDYEANLRHNIH